MAMHVIPRDGDRDLKFEGELLAEVASVLDPDSPEFSGNLERWFELKMYKTAGGRFVCCRVGRSNKENEVDRWSVAVCEKADEVFEFFRYGWLSKWLYSEAGLEPDCVEVIE